MARNLRIVRVGEFRHKDGRNRKDEFVQALIELLAGFIALLAAAALAQFGVDLSTAKPDREVHRVTDCREPASTTLIATSRTEDC